MTEDRWLLPRRQTEYPLRELISETKLHARREATFLALATISVVAITSLLALGVTRIIDVSALIATFAPDVELPIALAVPLGVVPFALGLVAVMLACELYGRRRAFALVWAGAAASAAVVGLLRLADVVDGGDAAFAPAVALASCSLVTHVATVLVFDALRGSGLWLRALAATLVAQAAGWAAFGGVTYAFAPSDVLGLAIGSAAVATACVVVAIVPLAIAARALTLFLRVSRRHPIDDDLLDVSATRLPPALIVEEVDEPRAPRRRRAARVSLQPYSSAEMRFFTEGDQFES